MLDRIYQFSELEQFMYYYSPKSPYGNTSKTERQFYYDADQLNSFFDHIEQLIKFIASNPHKADKIEYHLARIPRLTLNMKNSDIRSEIFNVKKFLHNFREIYILLDSEYRTSFSLDFHSETLMNLLGYEENHEETFYLNDTFSTDLSHIREELRRLNGHLAEIKEKRIDEIKKKLRLDFRFHDFLIIQESELSPDCDSYLYIEPFDNSSIIVKPVLGKKYFDIHNSRKDLLEKENIIEQEILQFLKNRIEEEMFHLKSYIKSVCDLDVSLAKARLAIRFDCIRPEIIENGNISYIDLNFVPLQEKCIKNNRKYTALTVTFDRPNIVINGSNMGGKTILLKTIAFSQLLIQSAFFVPAVKISTYLFHSIFLIGKIHEDWNKGLSSFGEEIMNIIETVFDNRTLILVDEFARTTNSREAFALNSALLQMYSEEENLFSFLSTHLDNLPKCENVAFWTMKGLDYEKYSRYYHKDYNRDLNERIKIINEFMNYSIEPQSGPDSPKDALKIADILGLDSKLIKYANKYLTMQEKKNG